MFSPLTAASTALAILILPSRLAAAPVGLFDAVTGGEGSEPSVPAADNGSPTFTKSTPYAYHTCPNGGTWTRFEDDFTTLKDEWTIETGARGVSTDRNGMTLTLDREMVRPSLVMYVVITV